MSDPSDFSIQQHTPAPLRLELKASFRVPPQELFKIVSDQHAVASWVPLMKAVSMEHRQGDHDGECSVGSVRHCTLRGMGALDETIVWWNPPHGYAFRVAAKSKMMMPTADHVSVMLIAPGADGGSALTWRHYFNWRGLLMRHLAAIMLPMMMRTALGNIRMDLEAADAAPAAPQCQKSPGA
jgi:hypothetical protein